MSDSRLEKFIYAICSMDVSDLPVPISRIEKLWNCLITGETPDFEPLSRNEKYLMAMLDRYDISNLPAPMSRGEKLLYKIAVGETDLSDVPGYLSRYEELLKYLIENGKNSEDDFEYVLHTLNQSLYTLYTTAEKPVKSAILKGQTLVNKMVNATYRGNPNDLRPNSNMEFINTSGLARNILPMATSVFEPNKTYTIILFLDEIEDGGLDMTHTFAGKNATLKIGANKTLYTTPSRLDDNNYSHNTQIQCNFKARYMVLDGVYTNEDIPFFEGMQSVKMPVLTTTGKNLFNPKLFESKRYTNGNNTPNTDDTYCCYDIPIEAKYGDVFIWSTDVISYKVFIEFDENGNQVYYSSENAKVRTYAVKNSSTKYIKVQTNSTVSRYLSQNPMLEKEPPITIFYEPYKSNILTVNEDVTLRGIGDVQDKLDCLTGEVTESIREIVLDGTQYMDADGRGIYIQVDDMKKVEDYRTIITCDKLPVFYHQWDLPNVENGIAGYLDEENKYPGQNWLYIKVNNSIDVGEVRQILTQKPITVQYQLAQESIKTVDLTVVDQDNQPTQLGTFENITYVSLEAENLIPEVEMEVATHISEELASASPLMDDISTKQEQLNTTIDEQSENVDATMIATTEIFEETL